LFVERKTQTKGRKIMSEKLENQIVIKGSSSTINVMWAVVVFCALVAVGALFLTEPALCFVAISLPASWFGIWMLIKLRRLRRSRIVISDQHLLLDIPDYAGGSVLPGKEALLNWDEIQAVTHERRVYGYCYGAVADEYTIHTERGQFTLAAGICAHPERVARMIADRAGCEFEGIGEADRIALKSLPSGTKKKLALIYSATAVATMLLIIYEETNFAQQIMSALSSLMAIATVVGVLVSILSLAHHYLKEKKRRMG
jgi:hypothetical protein